MDGWMCEKKSSRCETRHIAKHHTKCNDKTLCHIEPTCALHALKQGKHFFMVLASLDLVPDTSALLAAGFKEQWIQSGRKRQLTLAHFLNELRFELFLLLQKFSTLELSCFILWCGIRFAIFTIAHVQD